MEEIFEIVLAGGEIIKATRKERVAVSYKAVREGMSLVIYKIQTLWSYIYQLHHKTLNPIKNIERKELNKKVTPVRRCSLTEVSAVDVSRYRKAGIPSFVLKEDGKLYWCRIPKKLSFLTADIFPTCHLCGGSEGNVCKRLISLPNSQGGCEKVFRGSKGIERFDFIQKGYETFNTYQPAFYVADCLNFLFEGRREIKMGNVIEARLDLARNYLDEDNIWRKEEVSRICRARGLIRH